MGRSEPCVLFAQTFVHDILDEFVDEVLFAEPVVITACEFIEQNASSTCSMVKVLGATSPPSFALEVFVQCEGETRFRRLCQPFLYSHSSSNVLEVEAIVTSHLVIRGTYRSLSLVVYGNTTEDLGQFNIEVDLDSSLTNTVSAVEGDLEDLPPALRPTNLTIEESTSPLKRLSPKLVRYNLPEETKQLIKLSLKILDSPNVAVPIDTVLSPLLSAALVHATPSLSCAIKNETHFRMDCLTNGGDFHHVLSEATKELLDVYKSLQHQSGYLQSEISTENMFLESEADSYSSKQLVDSFIPYFQFGSSSGNIACPELSQNKNAILLLSLALLLCSAKESCFHFVNAGCMEKLGYAFSHGRLNSITLKLMLLGVVEQATRHSIGCEGFLGWWPREDENIPPGTSEGYNHLLKLLLENQRHDVASLSTYILNRLRLYEVASRYECAVLSTLGGLSAVGHVTNITVDMLSNAKIQLKSLLKLIHLRGPIEDPSPVAFASRSLLLSDAGLLSYKATSALIHQSNCCFTKCDVDSHVLLLLKERGFLPLSAALLSSSTLRSEAGHLMDLFVDVASYIESIFLSFQLSRSGLLFLLNDPDISTTIIRALKGADDWKKKESPSIRYASALIFKGFFCHPQGVGFIVEMHLKAINAIDRLIASTPGTEEFLWILWELCGLSRSNCGRQALLALIQFPEALSVLMAALHPVKELDPICVTTGAAPVNLAISHAAAEIFEVVVMDSTASSLGAWIDHANELHKMLNSSSPGSNKKDAPARLLEWIDAGVVYHRNGAIGLLRYAALLASGGDAHMASTSILTSDMMDVENVVGEDSNNSDGNVIDNLLGKHITEKDFPGFILRDSSVVQLTTAFRILAFISDHSTVAAALYDEGAVMVIHAVLINCKVMLERSSNIYDYLVDEGTECNATSDLLLERNREESLIALLIPSLVLVDNLLQKLQETKEQHRNTKLLNALLQLHREVSPKLAACAFDISYPYPESALGYEAVCHLLASILASWPVYGWTPGLFHFLLDNLQATSIVTLGPKEICSLFCLLNDLFPDEGVWLWKNSIPMLCSVRSFAVGTILGPQKESQINWYLQTRFSEKLLTQLTPQLDKIAQIIHHCATSTLVVIQDMLRVFIIRIANLNTANASALLRPLLLWVSDRLSGPPTLSDADSFKIYQILQFVAILLEHPSAKPLLLKEDGIGMFVKVLENCSVVAVSDAKEFLENRNTAKYGFPNITWCIPVFNCITLICGYKTSLQLPGKRDRKIPENLSAGECSLILSYILKFCKALPVGKELIACLSAFKALGTSLEGKNALLSVLVEDSELESHWGSDRDLKILNAREWREHPPLRFCWTALMRSLVSQDSAPTYAVEAIGLLSSAALLYCIDVESLNLERVAAINDLFGCGNDASASDGFLEGSMKSIQDLANLLGSEVMKSATSLLLLLQKPTGAIKVDDIGGSVLPPSPISGSLSSKVHKVVDNSGERIEDYDLNEFGDTFAWECPENLRDRLTQTGVLAKRKISSVDGPNRRTRGENASTETSAQALFSRGSVPPAPSGPTRRDTFRQRKPNTSRPPSMHVDDYVARERNADGSINPNVIAIPRIGSSSGRPPSIHVDEFMARQRDRQHPVGVAVSDATAVVKSAPTESISDAEKFNKSRQMKSDLDDDLQGIDIVFDAEEADLDDKLPFPQPDDNLPQPTSVGEQSPPHSIVEETESDANENSRFSLPNAPSASNMDENTPSEFSSRSVSRPDKLLTREPSITSEKKFPDQSDESKSPMIKFSRGLDSAAGATISGFSAPGFPKVNTAFGQAPGDSRTRHNLFSKAGAQRGATAPSSTGSQGSFDQRFQPNQPPLPPLPPPQTILLSLSQNADPIVRQSSPFVTSTTDVQPLLPPGFHVPGEYVSPYSSSGVLTSSSPLPESNRGRTSLSSPGASGSGSARPHPPLPPTPHPHSVNPSTISLAKNIASQSLVYSQNIAGTVERQQSSIASSSDVRLSNLPASGTMLTSYPSNSLVPPMLFRRPGSVPVGLYGSGQSPHHGENLSSILPNIPISLSSMHSLPSLGQLQPLQPPQLPRSAAQHLRPLVPPSPQPEQAGSLMQSPLQMPMQMQPQQLQVSPAHNYFQTPQSDNLLHALQQQQTEHSQAQPLRQPGDVTSLQQDMTLQEYFRSPEAIQSLLSDRDKLCQLLEQHPKLMQMLQERLGQL